ncbi:MAG: dockerin type I repeat-containing protein, partial [archaeon]|nr:dockerin type I repeat-containing protein [archaeon]
MDAKLIAAVAIVAAVAVVGGGAAVMFSGDDGTTSNYEKIDTAGTQGTVFGNANGDCRIDNEDVLLIQKIIEDNDPADLKKFPRADVDHNGTIDSEDLELTKAIVAKTATSVDVIDYNNRLVTVPYPIKEVFCAGGTNMRIVISVLGLEKHLTAVATNQYISDALDYNLVQKV